MPGASQPNERWCLICGSLGGIDFLANVALFAPLGIALVRQGFRWPAAGVLAAALSLSLELLQWRVVPGRHASAGDLLSNALGAGMAALVAQHWAPLLRPTVPRARGLLAAWFGVLAGLVMLAAWGIRPAPIDLVYFSQWAPARPGFAPFGGEIQAVRFFGVALPVGTAVDPTFTDPQYAAGHMDLQLRAASAAHPGDAPALLFRLANPLGEQLQVVQRGTSLAVRARTNSARIGLRSPSIVVDGALGVAETTMVHIRTEPGQARISGRTTRDVRYTIGRAWHTIVPFEVFSARADPWVFTLLPALLLLPLGWFARRARLPGAPGWLAVMLAALGGLPLAWGIAPGAFEVAGGVLGAVAGMRLAARTLNTAPGIPHR